MKKILVIEDEAPLRQDILEILECLDFHGLEAQNGKIGVQLAQQDTPDLIICDIMMPELDGYGVLKTLRDHPDTATIPFIFLSAKADKADIRKGLNLGADDYLTKPFTINELEESIVNCLEKQVRRHKALETIIQSDNDDKYSKLVQEEELLATLHKQLQYSHNIQAIIHHTLTTIRNLFQIHRCSFFVYKYNSDAANFDLIDQVVAPDLQNIPASISIQVVPELGQLILNLNELQVNDIHTEDELTVLMQKQLIEMGLNSILAVCTQVLSGEVGIIVCEHFFEIRTWHNNEVDLLQSIADQLPVSF
ncbi:MAG TPA: response regulator [Allocoleopsis sp.]